MGSDQTEVTGEWLKRQCREHFSEMVIGLMLLMLTWAAGVTVGAAWWAYDVHGELIGMRSDRESDRQLAQVREERQTLVDHAQWAKLDEHDKELTSGKERLSRVETRQELAPNKGGG